MASSLFAPVAAQFDRTEPFRSLTGAERASLLQQMTIEFYAAGEVVLQQGEDVHRALYVVTDGLVRLSDAETGRTVDMCGEGAHFGAYGLVQGGALPYEARAVEDQTACALVSADTFGALLASNEAFRTHFEEDIKRFVRQGGNDLDAAGAYLLFDTALGTVLRAQAPTVDAAATVREAAQAMAASDAALERGVFAQAIRPPTVPEGTSRLRLAVMAAHTKGELREAARTLGRAALQAGFRPGDGMPVAAAGRPGNRGPEAVPRARVA